ncbi:hypothetical protein BKA62DRAFT_770392 [Auriculariales sp. MPI-PUGE-AT-0066]|nr:hypothetical protein BKA62DRAFT_770392 [Auriculariales sp. MPI-PUGE-AT-0066]
MSSTLSVDFPGAFLAGAAVEPEKTKVENVKEDPYSEALSESKSVVTAFEDEKNAVVPLSRVLPKFPDPESIVDQAVQRESPEIMSNASNRTPRRASPTKPRSKTRSMDNDPRDSLPLIMSKRSLGQGVLLDGDDGSLLFVSRPRNSSPITDHSRNASANTLSTLASVPGLSSGRSSTDTISTTEEEVDNDHMLDMMQRFGHDGVDCETLKARASTIYSYNMDPDRLERAQSAQDVSKVFLAGKKMGDMSRPVGHGRASSEGHRDELPPSPNPMTPRKGQRRLPDMSPKAYYLQNDPFVAAAPSSTRPDSTYTSVSSMYGRDFRGECDVFCPLPFVQPDAKKHNKLFLPEPAAGEDLEKNLLSGEKSMPKLKAASSISTLTSSTSTSTRTRNVSQKPRTLTKRLSAVLVTDADTAASKPNDLSDDEPTDY